jgi:hypothetical protein
MEAVISRDPGEEERLLIFGAEHVRAKRQPQEIGCEYGWGGEPVFRLERLGKLAGARPLAGRAIRSPEPGEQPRQEPAWPVRHQSSQQPVARRAAAAFRGGIVVM